MTGTIVFSYNGPIYHTVIKTVIADYKGECYSINIRVDTDWDELKIVVRRNNND